MPNKLDYLSKYQEKPKKKKKRSKKEKAIENDVNEDALLPPPPEFEDEEEEALMEDSGDDGPVIVASTVDAESHQARGTWDVDAVKPGISKQKPPSRKQRHDSSSEDEGTTGQSGGRRHDSSSDESEKVSPRRERHDTDSSSSDGRVARRGRHDSDPDSPNNAPSKARKQRYDSSDDEKDTAESNRRARHDSSSDDDDPNDQQRMSSGHRAGLQTGKRFAVEESKIQNTRKREAKEMVDKHGVGETVYRRSKKNDASSKNKKKPLTAEENKKLHTGRAQLEQEERAKREFASIQKASFARHADDDALEEQRKREVRSDDPMAAFITTTRKVTSSTGQPVPARPMYKGPPPKPNRFGIPPGHRWDAHDRGNGFEDRLLAKRSSSRHEQEQAYRSSAADL